MAAVRASMNGRLCRTGDVDLHQMDPEFQQTPPALKLLDPTIVH